MKQLTRPLALALCLLFSAAVKDGTIRESRLDESVLRILREKNRLGIIT